MRLIRRSVHSFHEVGFQCVATIGSFDGLHLGHQAIIGELQKLAKKSNLPTTVITFEPSPAEFFLKENAPIRLMHFREKFETLQELAVDVMCVLNFNFDMASLSAEKFIQVILVEGLGVQHLVVGHDFRFGKNREGNVALLEKQGKNFGFLVTVLPTFLVKNARVSSTRIREALARGKIDEVESLLGRKVK